ncbi:hypothetical protein LOC67_24735 [Stieleria sp. JC731]|uniref:hypothetical protein n=1 Tax=Stieleria sp. JC731 TaxID=2894195 RepID=UPI001E302978|nr:hypothetical protein [Stieleria sp. JC731]MCC9603770.1 hypothetical protein [Stieleria sp. JC731]
MSSWIEKHIERAISQTVAGFGDWCVTLESSDSEDRWVQITWETVNFAFPSTDDPTTVLATLPGTPLVELVAAEPGSYVTISHGASESLPRLAELVAAYMRDVLSVTPDPSLWIVSEQQI